MSNKGDLSERGGTDNAAPEHGHGERDTWPDDRSWFDGALKRVLPNHTIMRRFIALNFFGAGLAVCVALIMSNKEKGHIVELDQNQCALIEYLTTVQEESVTPRPVILKQKTADLIRELDSHVDCNRNGDPLD